MKRRKERQNGEEKGTERKRIVDNERDIARKSGEALRKREGVAVRVEGEGKRQRKRTKKNKGRRRKGRV